MATIVVKRIYAVVRVGCLDCRNATEFIGIYLSLEAAQEAHPDAKLRSEMEYFDWFGEYVDVIFLVPETDP